MTALAARKWAISAKSLLLQRANGTTVISVAHSADLIATLAARIVGLSQGGIVA